MSISISQGLTDIVIFGALCYDFSKLASKIFFQKGMIIMGLKFLPKFERFALEEFLAAKRLVFVKADAWTKDREVLGSKVIVQIFEDGTDYGRDGASNFGEQLTVKVRNLAPDAFASLHPLQSEVVIKEVERAAVFGDFRNQLSIIAAIAVVKAEK